MKIKKLKIEGYKNLEIELEHNSDAIAVIGNNGSGKSNLLESLSYIFRSLYNEDEIVSFDYFVEYQNSQNEIIKIEKEKSKLIFHKDNEPLVSIKDYLPKKLIAIYSGEEDRLWRRCFKPFYDDFIKDINKTQQEGILYSKTPQMLYLNKFYWHISLLSLALSDLEDNKKFIKDILGINKIDKIKFDFNKEAYKNYSNSPTLEFIKTIDSKSEYTIPQLKKVLEKEGYIPDDVYRYLYLAFTPEGTKIIGDIIIKYNQHLVIEDLSEGEKKLLLVKAAFEFAEQEDSLFVLDEPDAHIHVNNKEQISKIIEPYKTNRQIILTTHSPTITQAMSESELFMIHNGKVIEKKKQKIISDITGEFWNKHQQNAFLASEKKLFLLVEGKHDKIHILNAYDKLKDEFPNLDFEIYSLGGEKKIYPFMLGIYEADLKNDAKYIAIYDSDKAGMDTLIKAGFEKDESNCGYRKLKTDKTEHNHFFAFPLVKPDGFTANCTIENMYSSSKYESAYREALKNMIGRFDNKSIEDINENIKKSSKNILANNSNCFEKEDFRNFRKIFDIINKIIAASDNNIIKKTSTKQHPSSENKLRRTRFSTAKIITEDTNLDIEYSFRKDIFYIKDSSINAKGKLSNNGNSFIIMKGSKIKLKTPSTFPPNDIRSREQILKFIKTTKIDKSFELKEDIIFTSPTAASKFTGSRNQNGWLAWKNKEGKSLHEVYRKFN